MTIITKREKKSILAHFPRAYIVSTKHRAYLAGSSTSPQAVYLRKLRSGRKSKTYF